MHPDLELFPGVRFDPAFAARAERAAARLWRARAASESAGAARIEAIGDDLAGTRAYRPGDDPRAIDWAASARSEAPVVRVLRRARGGSEVVALDASLSMAVGPPGKLQRAAEIAATVALLAARGGAVVTVVAPPSRWRFVLDRPSRFRALLAALANVVADGRVDWASPLVPRCERATWIGDLSGAPPDRVARVAPRGVALSVVQVLAAHEIDPRIDAPVTLVDPETGARLAVDASALAAHARELDVRHAALRGALARRGARFVRASSAETFEAACARLVRA